MSPESFQLLYKAMTTTGTVKIEDGGNLLLRQYTKRAIFFFSIVLTLSTTFYSLNWNPNLALSDRLFLLTVFFCHVFLLFQTIILWRHSKNLSDILQDIERISKIFRKYEVYEKFHIDFREKPQKVLKLFAK